MTSIFPIKLCLLSLEPFLSSEEGEIIVNRADALSLLVYIAEQGEDEYDRKKLGILLFGDESTSGRLRDAVFNLRKILGTDILPINSGKSEKLKLKRELLWVDTHEFTTRATRLLNHPNQDFNEYFQKEVAEVLAFYQAPFLRDYVFGSYELDLWQDERQATLAHLYHRLLEHLVRLHIRHGALVEAYQVGETWLQSLHSGFLPLQYMIWLALKLRQYAVAQPYITQLADYEDTEPGFIGPRSETWLNMIGKEQDDFLPIFDLLTETNHDIPLVSTEEFIGREKLVEEFIDLVDKTNLMTIGLIGLPGVGKTLFAHQVIANLRQRKTNYDIAWIELHSESDLEVLLNDALSQLGMSSLLTFSYVEKQRRFKQLLQKPSYCIFIDEGASTGLARPEFFQAVMKMFEGARLIFIARQLTGNTYYPFELSGFESSFVREFLLPCLSEQEASNSDIFDTVTAITGGLPLILKLLGGFIEDRRFRLVSFVRSMAEHSQFAWSLETALSLYTAILDWLWQLLLPDEKNLLYVISTFDSAEGCDEADLKAIADTALALPERKVDQNLQRLLALKLLQKRHLQDGSLRYSLHPIIYNDILTRGRQDEASGKISIISTAHSRYLIQFASAWEHDFLKLDLQKSNLIRAFTYALNDQELRNEAITLLNLLYSYFDRRGLYTMVEQLLELASQRGDISDLERIRLLCHLGQATLKQGRLQDAEQWLQKALELAKLGTWVETYSVIYRDLGRVSLRKGDVGAALEFLSMGQVYAVNQNQILLQAQIVANLGAIDDQQSNYAQAQARFEQILDLLNQEMLESQAYEWQDMSQFALNALGVVATAQGRYPQAQAYLQRGLEIARQLNNPERIARAYLNLGVLSYYRSDFEAAWYYFTQGSVVVESARHNDLLTIFTWNKGALKVIERDYGTANWLLQTAMDKANDLNLKTTIPYTLLWFGILNFYQKQLREALIYFTEILTHSVLNRWTAALGLYGLSLITRYEKDLLRKGDVTLASQQISLALEVANIKRQNLPEVTKSDLERAQFYFQIALRDYPELHRLHIVDGLWKWLNQASEI